MSPQKKVEDKDRPGEKRVLELGGEIKPNFTKVSQPERSNDLCTARGGLPPSAAPADHRGNRLVQQGKGRGARHTAKAAAFWNSRSGSVSLPICLLEGWLPTHLGFKSARSEIVLSPGKPVSVRTLDPKDRKHSQGPRDRLLPGASQPHIALC